MTQNFKNKIIRDKIKIKHDSIKTQEADSKETRHKQPRRNKNPSDTTRAYTDRFETHKQI